MAVRKAEKSTADQFGRCERAERRIEEEHRDLPVALKWSSMGPEGSSSNLQMMDANNE